MHDENIGKICTVCQKRDYIPYECATCKKQLCDEHYWSKEVHKCVINDRKRPEPPKGKKPEYHCGQCKCKLYTVNHYYCPECQHLYCLKHRHQESHSCEDRKSSCQLI